MLSSRQVRDGEERQLVEHTLQETLVSIKDVSLKFGEAVILKPTSVEVRDIVRPNMKQGQVIGILGPSGVGKTLFSRILAGLQPPTTGTVSILRPDRVSGVTWTDGVRTEAVHFPRLCPVTAGSVGVVFQNYPLFQHRTVLGNLLVALEHTNLSKSDRLAKAQEYLARFDLSTKADLYPAQLSGGQRQRVAIIQELLGSEHYLVMDEPFTGLDPLMKDKVCGLINQVATLDERNTIFVVAHDIGALVQIADTLWLFGRDRDVAGNIIPGAYIKETYNLIERGLAWRPNIEVTPAYHAFVDEVKERFKHL